jgi:hypothetical protein
MSSLHSLRALNLGDSGSVISVIEFILSVFVIALLAEREGCSEVT